MRGFTVKQTCFESIIWQFLKGHITLIFHYFSQNGNVTLEIVLKFHRESNEIFKCGKTAEILMDFQENLHFGIALSTKICAEHVREAIWNIKITASFAVA